MPLLLVPFVVLLLVLVVVAMVPIGLVMRYRAGTRRRAVRPLLATLNVAGFLVSSGLLLLGAAATSYWVPGALTATLFGFLLGVLLGLVGLVLSRWEATPNGVYFTPNRALVLGITVIVAGRIGYGVWRSWEAWATRGSEEAWLAAAGVAGSLGAGAVVLGYLLTYWIGVRRRATRVAA